MNGEVRLRLLHQAGDKVRFVRAIGPVTGDRDADVVAQRDTIHEMAGFLGIFERIIRTEHDAVRTERRNGAIERLSRGHARCRHYEVFLDVVRRRFGELDRIKIRAGTTVQTPQ